MRPPSSEAPVQVNHLNHGLSGTGHRYHDSPLPKTSSWMENCTKFGQLILSKIIKLLPCTMQLPDFKAKIHQIRSPLGLGTRPHWESLQTCSPDFL